MTETSIEIVSWIFGIGYMINQLLALHFDHGLIYWFSTLEPNATVRYSRHISYWSCFRRSLMELSAVISVTSVFRQKVTVISYVLILQVIMSNVKIYVLRFNGHTPTTFQWTHNRCKQSSIDSFLHSINTKRTYFLHINLFTWVERVGILFNECVYTMSEIPKLEGLIVSVCSIHCFYIN